MENFGKIELEVNAVAGVSRPFRQGGTWRMTIPKSIVSEHNLEEKTRENKYFSYVFISTDKGILLFPLTKILNPTSLKEALK